MYYDITVRKLSMQGYFKDLRSVDRETPPLHVRHCHQKR